MTPNVSYAYNPDGQRVSMTDGSGNSSYVYDALGRLTASTDGAGHHVGYGYDLAGNLIAITYPSGKVLARSFDRANRLVSVTDWLGGKTSFAYSPDSMLLSTTFPAASANVDRYGYDSANQLVSIAIAHGPSMLASLSDTRDPVGLLGSEAQTALPGAANTSYSYTALNQLATADSRSYAYDAADNLVKLDEPAATAMTPRTS